MIKYPRTQHILGSLGKTEPEQIALSDLPGPLVVLEEKLDGTQLCLRFEAPGKMLFQSRSTPLTGGPQEAEFNMFKPWAHAHMQALWERLCTRYVMYGEWLYAKHTVFYDALPHYFLEFDIWDRETQRWLSTKRRHALLEGSPVVSVPVLYQGPLEHVGDLTRFLQPSLYKTEDWERSLKQACKLAQVDVRRAREQTARSDFSEGLYLKSETGDETIGRYKFIRADFLSDLLGSGNHWRDRPIVANQLCVDVDLYDPMPKNTFGA